MKIFNIAGLVAAISATIVWGLQPVIIRQLILDDVNTFNIAFAKSWIAFFCLFVITLMNNDDIKKWHIKNKRALACAVAGVSLNILFFHYGLTKTYGAHAILIESASPLFVLLFGIVFFSHRFINLVKNEKVSELYLTICFCILGSSMLLLDTSAQSIPWDQRLIGDIIVFFAMIFFALAVLGMSVLREDDTLSATKLMTIIFGFVGIIMIPFIDINNFLQITPNEWILLIVNGIFCTALPFTLWNYAAGKIEPITLSILVNFSALFAIIFEFYFLDLPFNPYLIITTFVVIFSAYKAQKIDQEWNSELR